LHGARLHGAAGFGSADRIQVFGDDLFRLGVAGVNWRGARSQRKS
jgi:hypothetical protein